MTGTIVTPDQDAVISEIEIMAPAGRVFQALTDTDQLARWFTNESCPVKFWKMDARLGGGDSCARENSKIAGKGGREVRCQGESFWVDPPRLFVFKWGSDRQLDPGRRALVPSG